MTFYLNKTVLTFLCGMFLVSIVSVGVAQEKREAKPQTKLMIMDADGKNIKVLFQSDTFNALGSPVFSHDGQQIAMDGWKTGENGGKAHVLIIQSDGTGLKDLGDGAMPSWSPDGKQIAFSRYSPNNGTWTMNADGTNRKALDLEGWSAQWSPDGSMIAYTVRTQGGSNIKVYDRLNEKTFFLFPLKKNTYSQIYWNLCWSPDSKTICFKGYKRVLKIKNYELVTVDAKEGSKVKVHYSHEKDQPSEDIAWHPNGKKILFTLWSKPHKGRRIFSIDPTKEKAAPVLLPRQNYEGPAGNVSWHPDGKKIIFTIRK